MFGCTTAGDIWLELDDQERDLLLQLYGQLHELLAQDEMAIDGDPFVQMMNMDGPTQISDDAALARLFPNGYVGDEQASADFRRYTEPDLRRTKLTQVRDVMRQLTTFESQQLLQAQQAKAWLVSLNDLRLVIGTRIGISQQDDDAGDEDSELDSPTSDPGKFLYNYLTYLQGTLLDVMT